MYSSVGLGVCKYNLNIIKFDVLVLFSLECDKCCVSVI